MSLYNCIYYRKSIRKFIMEEISVKEFSELEEFIKSIQSLYVNVRYRTKIIDMTKQNKTVSEIGSVKAPYYVAFYSEKSEDALINAGYVLEQIVLYLTDRKIGSCYQGMIANDRFFLDDMRKSPVIVLAFGRVASKLKLEKNISVKRLSLNQLVTYKTDESKDINKI